MMEEIKVPEPGKWKPPEGMMLDPDKSNDPTRREPDLAVASEYYKELKERLQQNPNDPAIREQAKRHIAELQNILDETTH